MIKSLSFCPSVSCGRLNEDWVWARVILWGVLCFATLVDSLRFWKEQPTG